MNYLVFYQIIAVRLRYVSLMRTVLFAIITLLFFSCSNPYALEDKMCDCYRESFAKEGQDFDELVNTIEQHYLDLGVLQSNQGESYLKNVSILANMEFFHSSVLSIEGIGDEMRLLAELRRSSNCDFPETEGYENSSFVRMQNSAWIAFANGTLSESIWQIHLDELEAKDYNHIFYKADYFIVDYQQYLAHLFDYNLLPLKNEKPTTIPNTDEKRDVLDIVADSDDVLTVNGGVIQIDELYNAVLHFYQANVDGNDNDADAPLYVRIDSMVCLNNINELERRLRKDSTDFKTKMDLTKWQTKLELVHQLESGFYMGMSNRAVIRLKNEGGTSYGMYIEIQNIIKGVVNELRVEKCEEMGWPNYFDLDERDTDDQEYIKMLRILVPERVIESRIVR
jgi:hypothetical protein